MKKQKKKMNNTKMKRKTQDMEGNLTQNNTNDEQWLEWRQITLWWNPLNEGEEESYMEECGLAEARRRMKVVLRIWSER